MVAVVKKVEVVSYIFYCAGARGTLKDETGELSNDEL